MSSDLEKVVAENTAVLAEVKKLLETIKKPSMADVEESSRDYIVDLMLTHMNIPFIEDDVEKKIYDAILDIVFKVVSSYV